VDTRVAFSILGYPIYWYGIIITLAMMAAVWVTAREFERRGGDNQIVWDGALIVLACGIIGARLYHVFSEYNDGTPGWSYYRQNPIEILNLRSGGLGIFGGIAGGFLGALFVVFRHKIPFWQLADSVAPALLIGQGIGRWGNFFNQELYGGPTGSTWWGIQIAEWARVSPFNNLTDFPLDTRFHPTFFYESAWNLAGALLLLWLARRASSTLKRSDLFAGYLLWYGTGRLVLELTVRNDAWTYTTGGIPTGVVFALGWLIAGFGLLIFNRRRTAHVQATP
jgi:phosphatidylglycerol---prolipoprotein diacylglyceryl transferase